MEARIYFALKDSIAVAEDVPRLAAIRDQITATDMHPVERRALEQLLHSREVALRGGDSEVARPSAMRAD